MPIVASLILGALAGQTPQVPAAPEPPTRRLLRWTVGEVRCGGRTLPGTVLLRPYSALAYGAAPAPQTWRFTVGADGRPTGIARAEPGWAAGSEDIGPSLAASRLPPGAGACEATYTAEASPIAAAPVPDLVSYTLTPLGGPLPEEGWARIRPAGGDCNRQPRAEWRVHVTPDWRGVTAAPGVRDWTLLGYDLDAGGKPVRAAVATGTGNAALDRAALKALGQSRQSEGPRRGCLNPYLRPAARLPAPADVDLDALRPAGATCTGQADWARRPTLTYPDAWRRRAIEGWAVVAYDVAPWGETGNIRVLAAEPAAEFGTQAVQVIRSARRAASASGATGCVERVRFAMEPGAADPR